MQKTMSGISDMTKETLTMGGVRDRQDKRFDSAEKRESKGRVPLGTPDMKLGIRDYGGQLEGFVPRWINDKGGRIHDALTGGYEPVFKDDQVLAGEVGENRNSDMGSWVSQIVGTQEDGSPMRAYLMKIKREWYEEDQQAKQKRVDAVDEAIRGGRINEKAGDGRYLDRDRTSINL